MSVNRIQKLLFSEYCDFEDMVLVESPFAQTSREGKGIRQVHLGLTPSKLILATDVIPSAMESSVLYLPGIDPYIETFELVAVYPVECVNLSVFHRRKRQSLKAHFCNNCVLYFELGGFEKRNMFWNLWCERVRFLNPEEPGSSHSETSVASSTTNSTLYLLSSRKRKTDLGKSQVWCNFGAGDTPTANAQTWSDRHLLYNKNEEYPLNYKPVMNTPSTAEFVHSKRRHRCKFSLASSFASTCSCQLETHQINRFASGVKENCSTCLFLPAENCIVSKRFSEMTTQSADLFTMYPILQTNCTDKYTDLLETSVKLWEFYKDARSNSSTKMKHRRRYGFAPQSHFLNGLGPWNVTPGERYSIQVKRAVSAVNIRRQPLEPELRLPVSKRQLIASVSCEALHLDERLNTRANALKTAPIRPVIFFWTPEYWYRPRTARDAYQELQNHLTKIRQFHQIRHYKMKKGCKRNLFKKRRKMEKESLYSESFDNSDDSCRVKKLFSIFTSNKDSNVKGDRGPQETSLQYLRRVLRMDVALTAWDFDSTTIAYQLTLIDRDLFLKIPPLELSVLMWQQSSKNAPNVGAFIAFSHRVSCLVATEILRDDTDKIRARLIARFINTAEKCNRIANFQTCKSVLCGLQSPPIYRLHATWAYVRKRHASKYLIFEKLCRLYRDPRMPFYQESVQKALVNSPYIPFIGDIIAHLLDRIPDYGNNELSRMTLKSNSDAERKCANLLFGDREICSGSRPSILKKFFSSLKVWPMLNSQNSESHTQRAKVKMNSSLKLKKRKGLADYYTPLTSYEDNRIQRLQEAIEQLERYQKAATNYGIARNDLAREYLLKARYREDRENFVNSFSVEPCDQITNDR